MKATSEREGTSVLKAIKNHKYKHLLHRHGYNPDEWVILTETDKTLLLISKDHKRIRNVIKEKLKNE